VLKHPSKIASKYDKTSMQVDICRSISHIYRLSSDESHRQNMTLGYVAYATTVMIISRKPNWALGKVTFHGCGLLKDVSCLFSCLSTGCYETDVFSVSIYKCICYVHVQCNQCCEIKNIRALVHILCVKL
jgi:hypothetical protein